MSGAFGLAGWHFSSNPTSSSSENKIGKADGTEPWKTGRDAAYQYHPHGDPSKPRKDAPSALNEVIIPNVNLPKVSLAGKRGERIGAWEDVLGFEEEGWIWTHEDGTLTYDYSLFTRSTTSGARRATRRPIVATPILYRYTSNLKAALFLLSYLNFTFPTKSLLALNT